ncbi:NB-ARC domain-containing protein [Cohnella nanjingensis]|uniref:NB-ARC domain-containing protein n=1 Tax=Cohnella nanjingensis TaxID=1387779 RepID=A0A7X0VFC2_9BACL|nr:NB-ARC domain-containing protein [Cohnella nanjingensis]MBB6671905.1 hypothetical protein [Cohnella nanjingensis]
MDFIPFNRMKERVENGKKESPFTHFNDLLNLGEMFIKLTTLGILSAVEEEREEHRYRSLHNLVRVSGIGDWVQILFNILHGPGAAYIIDEAFEEKRQLSEIRKTSWHNDSAKQLYESLKILIPTIQTNWDGMSWFELFARLRNKTRGHGALTSETASLIIKYLEESMAPFLEELLIFKRQWVFLKQNLSGKYNVQPLSKNIESFNYLKSAKEYDFTNGVYIYFGKPKHIELIEFESESDDLFIANGGFTEKKYELLSYFTGRVQLGNSDIYKRILTPLPNSETDGLDELDVRGKCFTNLPPVVDGYVKRKIEEEIYPILINDRHPVVTLLGRGGVGKTSAALKVLNEIMLESRYQSILWFSSRDIDLKETGAKQVKPQVLTLQEMAREYWKLVDKSKLEEKTQIQVDDFLAQLTKTDVGPTLFVFDNFETVANPVELFRQLDTFIRSPNKILITTRHREFKGDYPIEVKGMLEPEFRELVTATTKRLNMSILEEKDLQELFRKSEGHPYVVKIALGEMSKPGIRRPLDQVIASRDDILDALFERTYMMLSPGAKRVFLTLCNWRSTLPYLAVEAVMLRTRTEDDRFDPQEAIEELSRVSFIEIATSDNDNELFINVPIAASIFGKRKLSVDQSKALIESATEFLQYFGATQNTDIRHGLKPRIHRLFSNLKRTLDGTPSRLKDYLPMLEFIARHYSAAWINIANLVEEFENENKVELVKHYLQKYLEYAPESEETVRVWSRIAELNEGIDDMQGVIHALIEKCMIGNRPYYEISNVANKFNGFLRERLLDIDSEEKRVLAKKLLDLLESRIVEASATDCSRIAWLCLHLQDEEKASYYTELGLSKDSENEYCLSLKSRFGHINFVWS